VEDNVEIIMNGFQKSNKYDFWKSASEISHITKLNVEEVTRVLQTSNAFYQSFRENEAVFTTKENFRKFQSFGRKLLGALKNRID
jgi:hypothetical protein